jgi:raffinose/stachyose/melibiose transport system permease protein
MNTVIKNKGVRRAVMLRSPIFILPAFICFVISFVIPFLLGLYLSFCKFNIPRDAHWVGFANYSAAFSDPGFWSAFGNSLMFMIASVVCINVPAFFIAYFLSEKIKGVGLFRTAFFIPNLIGGVVLGYIWSMLFDGILNYFGTYLTASPVYGLWGIVILVAWQQIGYMMIIYIAGFKSVPTDMLEAAEVDGVTKAQKLFRIILPNMISTISVCIFLTLTNSLKMFDQNLALTGGAPIETLENGMQVKTTELLALNIYTTYNINANWHGAAQAKAVIFFLLTAILAGTQLYLTGRFGQKPKKRVRAKEGAAKQ